MSYPQSSFVKNIPPGQSIPFINVHGGSEHQREEETFTAKLSLSQEALEIVRTKFSAPISIIVYVGEMGVGKSKFASVSACCLLTKKPTTLPGLFKSGGGGNSVTQGIWMWSEPLPNPHGPGSVMILDCEGMGSFNEHLGANLYLFCMIISTSFVIVLNSPRVTAKQSERLYHALLRYQQMKTQQKHVLPNIWLLLHAANYVKSGKDGDIIIDKSEWIQCAFTIDPNSREQMSNRELESIQARFNFINQMLPHKDAVKVDYLPDSLKDNNPKKDMWTLLREPNSAQYFQAVQNVLRDLLSTGGKVMPGSGNDNLYIRTDELTDFMQKLIDIINSDKMPNPESLIERFLRSRFLNEIVCQEKGKFESTLRSFAANVICVSISQTERVESSQEVLEKDKKMATEREHLANLALSSMIRRARCEIFGFDHVVKPDNYKDVSERQRDSEILPVTIRNELEAVEKMLENFREPERLIEKARFDKEREINQKHLQKIAKEQQKAEEDRRKAAEDRRKAAEDRQKAANDIKTLQEMTSKFHLDVQHQEAARQEDILNMTNMRWQELADRENELREYADQTRAETERNLREIERINREKERVRSKSKEVERARSRSRSRGRSQSRFPKLEVTCPRCGYRSEKCFYHKVDGEECGYFRYSGRTAVCMSCHYRKPIGKLGNSCHSCRYKFFVTDY